MIPCQLCRYLWFTSFAYVQFTVLFGAHKIRHSFVIGRLFYTHSFSPNQITYGSWDTPYTVHIIFTLLLLLLSLISFSSTWLMCMHRNKMKNHCYNIWIPCMGSDMSYLCIVYNCLQLFHISFISNNSFLFSIITILPRSWFRTNQKEKRPIYSEFYLIVVHSSSLLHVPVVCVLFFCVNWIFHFFAYNSVLIICIVLCQHVKASVHRGFRHRLFVRCLVCL